MGKNLVISSHCSRIEAGRIQAEGLLTVILKFLKYFNVSFEGIDNSARASIIVVREIIRKH